MKKEKPSLSGKDIVEMQEKLRAKDNEASETLISFNKGLINSCVRSFVTSQNQDSFDEYTQEARRALLKAAKIYDCKKNKSFYNFAKKVMTNALIDFQRQENRWRENEITLRDSDEFRKLMDRVAGKNPQPSPLDKIIADEKFQELIDAIKRALSEQEYEIMLLFYHENLSYKDISAKLSIETKAVDNILQAAKRKLKTNKKLKELFLNNNRLREE